MLNDNESVTVWTPSGTEDEFGKYTYNKSTAACQITEKFSKIKDFQGIEIISTHTIRSKTDIPISARISLTGNQTFVMSETQLIKNRQLIKDINNVFQWCKIWL